MISFLPGRDPLTLLADHARSGLLLEGLIFRFTGSSLAAQDHFLIYKASTAQIPFS